jgi:hypothetical protein
MRIDPAVVAVGEGTAPEPGTAVPGRAPEGEPAHGSEDRREAFG